MNNDAAEHKYYNINNNNNNNITSSQPIYKNKTYQSYPPNEERFSDEKVAALLESIRYEMAEGWKGRREFAEFLRTLFGQEIADEDDDKASTFIDISTSRVEENTQTGFAEAMECLTSLSSGVIARICNRLLLRHNNEAGTRHLTPLEIPPIATPPSPKEDPPILTPTNKDKVLDLMGRMDEEEFHQFECATTADGTQSPQVDHNERLDFAFYLRDLGANMMKTTITKGYSYSLHFFGGVEAAKLFEGVPELKGFGTNQEDGRLRGKRDTYDYQPREVEGYLSGALDAYEQLLADEAETGVKLPKDNPNGSVAVLAESISDEQKQDFLEFLNLNGPPSITNPFRRFLATEVPAGEDSIVQDIEQRSQTRFRVTKAKVQNASDLETDKLPFKQAPARHKEWWLNLWGTDTEIEIGQVYAAAKMWLKKDNKRPDDTRTLELFRVEDHFNMLGQSPIPLAYLVGVHKKLDETMQDDKCGRDDPFPERYCWFYTIAVIYLTAPSPVSTNNAAQESAS
ncbi:unnamed protein product [Amoebophrya sp. A25]|nr:unnamed protein product [Amoebophrya sp. A25]|eukprot:GSA25T00009538001.1